MMEDNNLYAIFWGCVATVIISIVVCITGYSVRETQLAAKSNNPALFECSLSRERQKTSFCENLSIQNN